MAVFVLDKHKKPLMPCSEKRARLLLERGRARVHKMLPFTIRLVDRLQEDSVLQDTRLKLDPGSKTTGVAVTLEGDTGTKVVALGEIVHKAGIKAKLDKRRGIRRSRRNRKTRYRKPRFLNRKRHKGWLPPSLEARVSQTLSAVAKRMASMPITAISTEHVKFDTQLMQNPEISGVEYQQGELIGYEVREYLLEKFGRQCAYCGGASKDVRLNVEHVVPKNPKRGPKGTDRLSNLVLACKTCNEAKGNRQPDEWLEHLRQSRHKIDQIRAVHFPKAVARLKMPLKDAAMMNATRWRLYERLQETGLPVEAGTGGRTKYQRIQHELPKEHYYDALCVGASTPDVFVSLPAYVQVWSAKGRGTRRMCKTDEHGFPESHRQAKKDHFGFRTGDWVVADVPKGKYAGTWKGRLTVRARGSFGLTSNGQRFDVHHKYCELIQRNDGWEYGAKRISA